jgi:sulfur carrier protein
LPSSRRRRRIDRASRRPKFTFVPRGAPEGAEIPLAFAFFDELDYDGTHVAVAVNAHVVPRARWTATNLETGDEVEIISPRQGG